MVEPDRDAPTGGSAPRPPRCVVTAGPTREYLDPVRFLSNPSTGRMGYALAAEATARGWSVDLVAGPTELPEPEDVLFYPVETGEEMLHQVDALLPASDVLLMTAAVTDFRPAAYREQKEKKDGRPRTLPLEPVPDLLATFAERRGDQPRPLLVGFAAETENLESHARDKLVRKNLDLIAANRVDGPGGAFGAERSALLVLDRHGGRQEWGPAPKTELAARLLDRVEELLSHAPSP